MHRRKSLPKRLMAAFTIVALAVAAGAFSWSWAATPVADSTPAVEGTYLCVVTANGDGFGQQCTLVTPSGSPTASPPAPTATPTVTPTPEPTTPSPTRAPSLRSIRSRTG